MLFRSAFPGGALLAQLQQDSANLCKCEEVTVGAFAQLLEHNPHVATASAAKLLSRVGMGYCQGRYCQFSLIRILAARRGIPETLVGGFTARFPTKPVVIDRLLESQV